MPNTQNTLPAFSVVKPAVQSADSVQTKSVSKLASAGDDVAAESGFFASFLMALTQTVDQMETDGALADRTLELTLSAGQGEAREEQKTTLPLNGMGDTLSFSKSVLELLASLKNGLEEKGVDTQALSDKVEEVMGTALPGMDPEQLKAMLSKLRSRYSAALQSDTLQCLDVEFAVNGNLKIGLEASLNKQVSNSVVQEADLPDLALLQENAEAIGVPEEQNENKNEVADETLNPLALSRIYAYLKTDMPHVAPSSGADTPNDSQNKNQTGKVQEKKASFAQRGGGDPAAAEQTSVQAVPLLPNQDEAGGQPMPDDKENLNKDNLDKGNLLQSKAQGKNDKDNLEHAVPQSAGLSDKKDEGEGQSKVASSERRTGFEQFFDGVMSRRQGDIRGDAMQLAKEAPLSQNEALREGLDNVVRFIRTSGEQKASLIVDPPALGRISVELTSSTSGLDASIKVSSEQVRQLVQDQIAQLKLSLAQQGVQLTHFSVDVQQDDTQQRRGAEQQGGRKRHGSLGANDQDEAQDEPTGFRVDLSQGLLYWLA